MDNLKDNESDDDVEPLVKAIKEAHDSINNEDDKDLINVTKEELDVKVKQIMVIRRRKSYTFLVKAGEQHPTTVSGLLSCLWRVCYQRGLPRLVFTSW